MAASSGLAMAFAGETFAGGGTYTGGAALGPCLVDGMGESALIANLNAWGSARDQEVLDLRATLGFTHVSISAAFEQAKEALLSIVASFRGEAENLRQHGQYEATASIARLELVVSEARARFDVQDLRFAESLAELARRLAVVDAWAQAEPARVAALVQSAPVQCRAPLMSPGGTTPLTFYPSPGLGRGSPAPFTPQRPQLQPSGQQQAWEIARDAERAAAAATAAAAAAATQPQQQQPGGAWGNYQPTGAAPPMPDPWAASRLGPAQETPGAPRHFDMFTPGGGGKGGSSPHPREMRVDARSWGDHRKLDVTTTFDGFQVWKDRAQMFLSNARPDVRRLLAWAEAQSKDSLEAGIVTQADLYGVADLAAAEFAVHDGIKVIIQDSLLGRARNCVEHGFELWRSLTAEWSGAAPQLKHAKARRYQEPTRCRDIGELWSRLPSWERLGEEVKLAGLDLPEWLRSAALEKLLPTQLLSILIARPELSSYAGRVAWVKTQMEHARGLAQASAYAPTSGKDASGDVLMGSLEAPPGMAFSESGEGLVWALHAEKERHELAGDWAQAESVQSAIFAMTKGKGKGKKGGLGKGGPKGAQGPGKGAGAAPAEFNGTCNHCGIWGHRLADCRKLSAEMAKGGGKGKQGGGKGGKGPILECAAEDDWSGEGLAGNEDLADESWFFDNIIASVSAASEWQQVGRSRLATPSARPPVGVDSHCCEAHREVGSSSARPADHARHSRGGLSKPRCPLTPAPWGEGQWTARGATPTTVRNRFAALSLLRDDAEPIQQLIGAVSGGEARGNTVIECVVDSGAVHSVAPPQCFPGLMSPSPWSRAGRGYRAANGTGIKNLGQVQVAFGTTEGHKCQIPFQVAEVEQPLLSVAHLTAAGNRVEMGGSGGRIVNLTTGRTIALEKRGGVYLLKMLVVTGEPPAPFRRQGA